MMKPAMIVVLGGGLGRRKIGVGCEAGDHLGE